MAQVARTDRVEERINSYLAYLERKWRRVPDLARMWNDWDDDERLDFVVEWPIREDRLGQLQQWAAKGALTPGQHERYDGVLTLVAEYRPTMERLLAE